MAPSNNRECPENTVYIECFKDCMPTCFEKKPPMCILDCRYGGCACKRPLVFDEQARKCVHPLNCTFRP
ncbi:TIL domain-containing protein [Nephila pilipes]|uniref:TIL domain-containing protein n=1 Tax=Nephila pilipes TaxID=299642 RepID=A0A8X6K541_NEPPI|nr:TIL domain-containing protein [Nephila pilipes]